MNISFMIEMLLSILRGFLFNTKKAAPYAKWLLRIRDYLLLMFPIEMYPINSTADAALASSVEVTPVPISEVKKAGKGLGFNIPFIKGM